MHSYFQSEHNLHLHLLTELNVEEIAKKGDVHEITKLFECTLAIALLSPKKRIVVENLTQLNESTQITLKIIIERLLTLIPHTNDDDSSLSLHDTTTLTETTASSSPSPSPSPSPSSFSTSTPTRTSTPTPTSILTTTSPLSFTFPSKTTSTTAFSHHTPPQCDDDLQQQLTDAVREKEELHRQNAHLQMQLTHTKAQLESFTSLTHEKAELLTEIEEKKTEISELHNTISHLRVTSHEQTQDLLLTTATLTRRDEEIKEKTQRIVILEQQVEELAVAARESRQMRDENELLTEKITKLNKEKDELRRSIPSDTDMMSSTHFKREKDDLLRLIETLQSDNRALRDATERRLGERENMTHLEEEVGSLRLQLGVREREVREKELQCTKMKEENENFTQDIHNLTTKLKHLQTLYENSQSHEISSSLAEELTSHLTPNGELTSTSHLSPRLSPHLSSSHFHTKGDFTSHSEEERMACLSELNLLGAAFYELGVRSHVLKV
jgi:myosin heavy subunit